MHGNRVYVCLPALCDNINVAGKDVQLIVTDFIETAWENCTILKSCLASQILVVYIVKKILGTVY